MTQPNLSADNIALEVQEVSSGILVSLLRHASKLAVTPTLSRDTQKHIKKRVSPSNLENYLTPEEAVKLLAIEISDLGMRISYYRYIERYREHFSTPGKEMGAAFVTHTHILRGSEIYVIQEKCRACLKYFHSLAVDLQLSPKSTESRLQNSFKKEFERHLRERHRIVHSHESPSLISRILNVPLAELEGVEARDSYASIFTQLLSMANDHLGIDVEDLSLEEGLKQLNDKRLIAVDKECVKMWSIFLKGLTDLIDASKLMK